MTPRETKISAILEALDIGYDSTYRDVLQRGISRLSESTLDLFPAIIELHRSGKHQYKHLYSLLNENYSEQSIREVLFYRPLILEPDLSNHLLHKLIAGLRQLDRFTGLQQAEELAGDDLDVALAFINVTFIMLQRCPDGWVTQESDEGRSVAYIKDTDLQDLIAAHPKASELMADYIKTRHTGDPILLREYVESTTPLKQGVL